MRRKLRRTAYGAYAATQAALQSLLVLYPIQCIELRTVYRDAIRRHCYNWSIQLWIAHNLWSSRNIIVLIVPGNSLAAACGPYWSSAPVELLTLLAADLLVCVAQCIERSSVHHHYQCGSVFVNSFTFASDLYLRSLPQIYASNLCFRCFSKYALGRFNHANSMRWCGIIHYISHFTYSYIFAYSADGLPMNRLSRI